MKSSINSSAINTPAVSSKCKQNSAQSRFGQSCRGFFWFHAHSDSILVAPVSSKRSTEPIVILSKRKSAALHRAHGGISLAIVRPLSSNPFERQLVLSNSKCQSLAVVWALYKCLCGVCYWAVFTTGQKTRVTPLVDLVSFVGVLQVHHEWNPSEKAQECILWSGTYLFIVTLSTFVHIQRRILNNVTSVLNGWDYLSNVFALPIRYSFGWLAQCHGRYRPITSCQ